ncbi:MAG: hypothetical protein ABEI31_08620 [Halodesulfurarchaeum sp.]
MTLAEDRIFDSERPAVDVYVAAAEGVVALDVAGDRVGTFELAYRGAVEDVAATDESIAVATPEDVLLGDRNGFERTGFGPAVAVGGDPLLAVDTDGRVHTRAEGWTRIGSIDGRIAAVDGDLLASSEGVYRRREDAIEYVGLDRVRDVSTEAVPLAATAEGVFRLGAGWMAELEGDARVVAATEGMAGEGPVRAHAVTEAGLFEFASAGDGFSEGNWVERQVDAARSIVDIDYFESADSVDRSQSSAGNDRSESTDGGTSVVAVTSDGVFLVDAGNGFRRRSLGVSDVVGLAVGGEENA